MEDAVRKAALQMMDYDRIVVPNSSRPHAAMHPEGSCRRTATSTWPSMPTLEKICEKTHPTPTLLKPDFSVFLLQNGVMMTNA